MATGEWARSVSSRVLSMQSFPVVGRGGGKVPPPPPEEVEDAATERSLCIASLRLSSNFSQLRFRVKGVERGKRSTGETVEEKEEEEEEEVVVEAAPPSRPSK